MKMVFLSLLMFIPLSLFASPCEDTAESEQWVIVMDGVDGFPAWKVNPDEIHSLSTSSGFSLGLKITPVTDEFYRERLEGQTATPEMVKITLFDMSKDSAERITYTYGGSNSVQGYSSKGGATAVEELGEEGIQFLLHKATCISLEELAKN